MGNIASPTLACLYLSAWEKKIFQLHITDNMGNNISHPKFWKRYMDDIVFKGKTKGIDWTHYKHEISNIPGFESIEVTLDESDPLPVLDLLLTTSNNAVKFTFYRKETSGNILINMKSGHEPGQKKLYLQ